MVKPLRCCLLLFPVRKDGFREVYIRLCGVRFQLHFLHFQVDVLFSTWSCLDRFCLLFNSIRTIASMAPRKRKVADPESVADPEPAAPKRAKAKDVDENVFAHTFSSSLGKSSGSRKLAASDVQKTALKTLFIAPDPVFVRVFGSEIGEFISQSDGYLIIILI
jgi:hypothetical protein